MKTALGAFLTTFQIFWATFIPTSGNTGLGSAQVAFTLVQFTQYASSFRYISNIFLFPEMQQLSA